MPNEDYLQYQGVVIQALGNARFKVTLDDGSKLGRTLICTLSGSIKKNTIKIIEGDKVSVDVSIYDTSKGRITFRHKG